MNFRDGLVDEVANFMWELRNQHVVSRDGGKN